MSRTADPERPNWVELPRDVTAAIFSKLGAIEVLTSVQYVCSSWLKMCKDPSMWRTIDMHNLGDSFDMNFDLEKICRVAIDRSNGNLSCINLEYFGNDELLHYIADRSSNLKNLRLVFCYSISDRGLIDCIGKFPLLEELDLSYCSLSIESLEAVGHCCPLLKSLKLNIQGSRYPVIECDEEALVIGKYMHELRHLQLFGNRLTNSGLEAILNGCPHLESLDLRQCFNVNLEGNLEKRCFGQIKDLRRPNDSTSDYEFDAELPSSDAGCESFDDYDDPYGVSDIELLTDEDNYDDSYYEFSDYNNFDYVDLFFD
ncbi:hypothetical protein ACOSP7_011505 [Xanthoceras sorbifolium]